MVLKSIARGIIGFFRKIENWSQAGEKELYSQESGHAYEGTEEIHSVWDYLEFRPNTQAYHLASTIGFEEWVDMAEIRRRIKELFGIEYKNERSLYPYLKTLSDMSLMENSSVGGRMHWRKHDLLIKITKGESPKETAAEIAAKKEKKRE